MSFSSFEINKSSVRNEANMCQTPTRQIQIFGKNCHLNHSWFRPISWRIFTLLKLHKAVCGWKDGEMAHCIMCKQFTGFQTPLNWASQNVVGERLIDRNIEELPKTSFYRGRIWYLPVEDNALIQNTRTKYNEDRIKFGKNHFHYEEVAPFEVNLLVIETKVVFFFIRHFS